MGSRQAHQIYGNFEKLYLKMADVDDRGSAGGEEEGKDLWYWNIKNLFV